MKCHYCNEREATHRPEDKFGEFSLCCFCYVKRGYPVNPDHPDCMRQKRVIEAEDHDYMGRPRPNPEERYTPPSQRRVAAIRRALDVYDKHFRNDIGRSMTQAQLAAAMNAIINMMETEHRFYGINVDASKKDDAA